jgi:hypothetical protein
VLKETVVSSPFRSRQFVLDLPLVTLTKDNQEAYVLTYGEHYGNKNMLIFEVGGGASRSTLGRAWSVRNIARASRGAIRVGACVYSLTKGKGIVKKVEGERG